MKKYTVGVIGLGFGKWLIEEEILQGLGEPYFTLAAVCDLNEDLAKKYGEKYAVPYSTEPDELLHNPGIDLILLITGPNGRARLLDRILDAGKPVMTTKPFETDAAEAARILAKAEKLGIPLFSNSPPPVPTDDLACIKEWQEKYNLGRLVAFEASNWASYREQADGSWYDDPFLAPAAPLLRLGIYCMDDLAFFVPDEIASVSVKESRVFTGRPTADNAIMSLAYEDGTLGSIYASLCVGDGEPYQSFLQLHYENGNVIRKIHSTPSMLGEFARVSLSTLKDGEHFTEERTYSKKGYGYRWDLMHQVLSGEKLPEPSTGHEVIVRAVHLLETMMREARSSAGEKKAAAAAKQ